MRKKMMTLLTAILLHAPVHAFAQSSSSEFGVMLSTASFRSTVTHDPEENADVTADIHSKVGGIANFNHYWTPHFSTELFVQNLRGDLVASSSEFGVGIIVGKVNTMSFGGGVQWHFTPASQFDSYIGLGAAYTNGHLQSIPLEIGDVTISPKIRFKSRTSLVPAAGVSYRLTDRLSLALDARYIPFNARPRGEEDEPGAFLKLDPLTLSTGLRLRF